MTERRTDNKTVNVGGNFIGDSVEGDGNFINKPTIHNNIDGEVLGQSLGETISDREEQARWNELHREGFKQESREVMETVFVSIVSGIAIGSCWKFAFPWNVNTVPFFVIATTVLFNITRVTNFGLRRSIFKVILLSTGFSLLLKYAPSAQSWMEVNQFVGTIFLATIGAIIGLLVGVIQIFWHPLED